MQFGYPHDVKTLVWQGRSGRATALGAIVLTLVLAGLAEAQEAAQTPSMQDILTLLEQGETKAAEALLVTALDRQPDAPRLLALLGTARYLNRKHLAAEEPLRRAVELGRRDLTTYYYLTSTLWENGRFAAAETICLTALETHGNQLPLVHLLGRLYLWQGRHQEAEVWLERATTMSPRSVDLWLDLASALDGAERFDEALVSYRRAVDLAPEHYQARYGLARMLARTGDAEAAQHELVIYRRLLEEDQQRTQLEGLQRSRLDLGYDYLRRGEIDAAIAHLEGLPMTTDRQVALARAYRQAGNPKAAIAALEEAVAMSPAREDLRAQLAAVRLAESPEP